MACTTGSSEGLREEEVLHIDDDEGGFGRIDGDGNRGCGDRDSWCRNRGLWRGWMGKVETMIGVVQPKVRGLPDERLPRWMSRRGDGLHIEITGM